MITALIVEDEKIHIETLKNKLSNFPDIEIIGIAEDIEQFEEKTISLRPDIAFLDIILRQENSLDRLKKMINDNRIQNPPFVIITTAHDNEQFRKKAQDDYTDAFLNKPINFDELKKAINFVKKKMNNLTTGREYNQQLLDDKKIKLHSQAGEFIYIDITDFLYAKSSGNFTEVYLKNRDSYELISKNLGWFEDQFINYRDIRRLSRTLVINVDNIFKFVFKNRKVEFCNNTKLKLGEREASRLKNYIE